MEIRWCLSIPCDSVHLRYPWISVFPPLLIHDVLEGGDWASLEMHLKAVTERVWRCNWRQWSCKFRDAPGGRDRVNLKAVIESIWEDTCRPWSSTPRDALRDCNRSSLDICTCRPWSYDLGGRDRVSWEIHLEAKIVRTRRPRSCEFGGRNHASPEIQLVACIEWVWRCTSRPWSSDIGGVLGGGQSGGGGVGGRRDGS